MAFKFSGPFLNFRMTIRVSKSVPSIPTSNNDGGGCPFTEFSLGPINVINAECEYVKDGNGKSTLVGEAYFLIKISNPSPSSKSFEIHATVDDGDGPDVTADENANLWNWKEVTVSGNTKADDPHIEKGKVKWGERWEVKVRNADTDEEILFEPNHNTLNELTCDEVVLPPDEFEPKVSFVYKCSEETPKVPQVEVTLDNSDSTIEASFSLIVDGTTKKEEKTVAKGETSSVTIELDEDAEWSITWEVKPPESSIFDSVGDVYEPSSNSPTNCIVEKFEPEFKVTVECNNESNKPEMVITFNNLESTVGGKFELWLYVNEEPFDGKGFNWPAEDEFSAGDEDRWRPVPFPEDSTWYFDWKLTPPEDSVFDSKEGKESQGVKSPYHSEANSSDTNCVNISECDQSCGDVYGYVWVDTNKDGERTKIESCLLYTSPSPRDRTRSRMPSSA